MNAVSLQLDYNTLNKCLQLIFEVPGEGPRIAGLSSSMLSCPLWKLRMIPEGQATVYTTHPRLKIVMNGCIPGDFETLIAS